MTKIRVGVIGCGIIAQNHLDEYSRMPDVEIVALCDIKESALKATAAKYNVTDTYLNFRDMLKRDDIDAVSVCLHNNLHAPITCEVLQSGKHCYCEKPMAGSWADAKAMYDAALKAGKMLHIQLAFLYIPETSAAQKLISAGRLGHIYHARSCGHRRRGRPFVDGYAEKEFNSKEMAAGGALYDMGVYHISQLLYLLDRPKLLKVSGRTYQEVDMDANRRDIGGFSVEELGVGFARFENDLTIDVIESWAIHMDDFGSSFIAGSDGGIRLSPFKFLTSQNDITMDITADLGEDEYRNHQLNPKLSCYNSSAIHFVAALRGDVPLLPTADIALDTMLLSEGIYISSSLGREVTADEIREMSKSVALRTQETPFGELVYNAYPFL